MCVCYVYVGAHSSQEKVSDALKLEFQIVVSHPDKVTGLELGVLWKNSKCCH